jgi:hypothetical protein
MLNSFVLVRCDDKTFQIIHSVGLDIDFFVLLVEDDNVLEKHVGGVEVVALDPAVEGVTHGLVIGVRAAFDVAVAARFVAGRIEVVLALFRHWRHDDVEGESLTSLLALGQQQIAGVTTVVEALETERVTVLRVAKTVQVANISTVSFYTKNC